MSHTLFHHLLIAGGTFLKGLALLTIWLMVFLVGLFFWSQFTSPLNLVLGLPLMLLGFTMSLINLFEMLLSLISWRWGREHCPFCPPPEEVEEILSPQNGFQD